MNTALTEALWGIVDVSMDSTQSCETRMHDMADIARVALAALEPPYPEFCHHPEKCVGKSQCPRDPTCAD